MTEYKILSLRVGLPTEYGTPGAKDPMDRPWRTGFFKEELSKPAFLGRTNIEGDGQADLRHHGGPEKAVCVYPACRYPYWRERLDLEMPFGAFGENITVQNAHEESVCVGDIYKIGDATVQITQPRSPCWKLARRWRIKELALYFQQTGYTGWYLRVLEEGTIAQGQIFTLLERPHPQWTIKRLNEVRYNMKEYPEEVAALAQCTALGESWRRRFQKVTAGEPTSDESKRLIGKNEENHGS